MSNYHTLRTQSLFSRPVGKPDLGSSTSSYGNLFLKNKIFINNAEINPSTLIVPRVTSVAYQIGATANTAGNETLTINGTGFVSDSKILLDRTQVETVTYVSSTQLTITTPAKSAGVYSLFVVNPDGSTGAGANGITYT